MADGRREVLGERVRPQHDLAAVGRGRRRVGEPVAEGSGGDARDPPLARQPAGERDEPPRRRDAGHRIDETDAARDPPGAAQPAGQPPEEVVAPRPKPAAVPLVEDLGLVARHVDAGRAVGAAGAAGQAQVERIVDLRRAPAVLRQRPRRHLLEQPRPAAGRVALLAGRAVGRAHERVTLRRDAAPDADAALDGRPEVAAICLEREAGRERLERRRTWSAEVDRERRRVHDDAGVEQAGPIPDRLPLPERGEHRRAELAGQELAPGTAVAVLPAERAAVRHDEVRGPVHEPAEARLAARRVEPEAHPQVDAALPEVAVRHAPQVGVAEEAVERGEIRGEALRRDGGVLEPGPGRRAVGEPRRTARAILADAPQGRLRARVLDERRRP